MKASKNFLLQESEKIRKEADLLLKKSIILKILSQYGKPKITGSYKLNLMMNGDIDINVASPKMTKEKAIDFLNKMIHQEFFKGYLFYDFVKFSKTRQSGFPKGYYIGLKSNIRERKWKIDVWFIKKDFLTEIRLMNFVQKNLNNKNKIDILRLKHYRNLKNLDIPSAEIYAAVLKHNIITFKNLLAFMKSE